jgi:hypothetical protein
MGQHGIGAVSTSIQPAAKAQLFSTLTARANLSAVQVTYGHPGSKRVAKECIWIGNINGDQTVRVVGAYSRLDDFAIEMVVDVQQPGDDQQTCTERAYALMAEVESAVRSDPTLSGVVNIDVQFTGELNLKEFIYDQGREAELTFEIQCRGKI